MPAGTVLSGCAEDVSWGGMSTTGRTAGQRAGRPGRAPCFGRPRTPCALLLIHLLSSLGCARPGVGVGTLGRQGPGDLGTRPVLTTGSSAP